jgi:shikimate 5-dehydrogenase
MNGDVMLLHQTAAAFELWTGQQAPMATLRERLDVARDEPEVVVAANEGADEA